MKNTRVQHMNFSSGNAQHPVFALKLLRGILLVFIFVVFAVQSTQAQIGYSAVPFLRIEPDARTAAGAGAGATLLDGGFGGFYNPAALGWQRGASLGLSYSNWLPDVSGKYQYNYLAGTYEMDEKSSLSGSLIFFNMGEQKATDIFNTDLGSFSNYELAARVSYGRLIGRQFSVGAGLKYIHSSIGTGQQVDGTDISPSSSVAIDLGSLWRSQKFNLGSARSEFRAGTSFSNLGSAMNYLGGELSIALPLVFRTGFALSTEIGEAAQHQITLSTDLTRMLSRLEETVIAGDTTYTSVGGVEALFKGWSSLTRFNGQENVTLGFFEQFTLGFGVEYWFNQLFSLRSGYFTEHPENGDRRFLTAGAGIRYRTAEVDFSYLSSLEQNHPLDGTIRVSLRLYLSKEGYKTPRPVGLKPLKPMPVVQVPPAIEESIAEVVTQKPAKPEFPKVSIPPVPVPKTPEVPTIDLADLNLDLVRFPTMSSEIEQENRDVIARAVVALQQYPTLKIWIQGHTDSRGSDDLNEMLSEARARAIWLEMLSYGVVDLDRVGLQGLSDDYPVADNDTREGRQANRRGELISESIPYDVEWINEEPTRLIEFDSELEPGQPLNKGTELAFNWLDPVDKRMTVLWLKSIAAEMESNPEKTLSIATWVYYETSGSRFLTEIRKARSEKIMALLISLGVEQDRIQILTPTGTKASDWEELITPQIPEGDSERMWFILQ